jgi:hypothetical protein
MLKEHQIGDNREFYANCSVYFAHLRKENKSDMSFEDEFYFTIPAISSKS